MGGKKKIGKTQSQENQVIVPDKKTEDEKRFVNLLHIYTIYKQKFRRISKEEFEKLLCSHCKVNQMAAVELCKELMKAKQIPKIIDFDKNVGFLSVPRLMPLIALLAERSGYKLKPSLVNEVDFKNTPQRFKEKFSQLMVYGFWFLGRVISDSLSSKEQVSRGNMFNFAKGDMGFWWAGVKVLDWICFVKKAKKVKTKDCYSFVTQDPPQYRFYSSRAVINMHNHQLYFLSETDWLNFISTVKTIGHKRIPKPKTSVESDSNSSYCDDESSSSLWSNFRLSYSDISSLSKGSETSVESLASKESID